MTRQKTYSKCWVLGLGAAFLAVFAGGFFLWDQMVVDAVREGGGRGWRGTARFLSRYGDFPWLLGGGLLGLAFCLLTKRRDWARILTSMLLAGVVAGLASNLIKLGSGRVRPRVDHIEHGWYGPIHRGEWVSLQHDYQGFPSSHAACAFGFFVPLFLSRRRAGSVGLLLAAGVAWSRVQLNAHHISDVAAGALIGLFAGWMIWRWIVHGGGLSRWLGSVSPASPRSEVSAS